MPFYAATYYSHLEVWYSEKFILEVNAGTRITQTDTFSSYLTGHGNTFKNKPCSAARTFIQEMKMGSLT